MIKTLCCICLKKYNCNSRRCLSLWTQGMEHRDYEQKLKEMKGVCSDCNEKLCICVDVERGMK